MKEGLLDTMMSKLKIIEVLHGYQYSFYNLHKVSK